MPLLRPETLPLPATDIEAVRARLTDPFAFEAIDRDRRRFLFIRCPTETPHPVTDVETVLQRVPPWALKDVHDLFLLGDRSDLHVPPSIAKPLFESRHRLDAETAQRARAELDPHYGISIRRITADPEGTERLLVRLPRHRCIDVTEADLVELATRIGPLHDQGALRRVTTCFLIAERDHYRFAARDFLADLVPRWVPMRPSPPPPRTPPATPSAAPRRVEDVTPLFEVEENLDARPAEDAAPLEAGPTRDLLAARLQDEGYHVAVPGLSPESPFLLEADRVSLFPNRIAALGRARLGRREAEEALALARTYDLDLLLFVGREADPEALGRLAASRVKFLIPGEVAQFRP